MSQLIQEYELDKIKDHIRHIEPCNAIKGEGLVNGIKWLSEQLVFRGKNNFPINPYEYDNNREVKKKLIQAKAKVLVMIIYGKMMVIHIRDIRIISKQRGGEYIN